jgi:proteasome beta subunit
MYGSVGEKYLAGKEGLHGTTTVGLIVKDAVILAADKRATAGTYIAHRTTKKIIRVWDRMALTTAGLVADAQMLAEWLENQLRYDVFDKKRFPTVRAAAHLLSNLLYSYKLYPFYVQLLLGGYDTKPRLFSLDFYGSVLEEKFAATGSGSPIAIGVIEDGYSEDLSVDEGRKLAVTAVRTALKRDSATGDGVDSIVISKDYVMEYSEPAA